MFRLLLPLVMLVAAAAPHAQTVQAPGNHLIDYDTFARNVSDVRSLRESRRISSASASRTACANVSSRSGIDVFLHFIDAGIGRCDSELHRSFHDGANLGRSSIKGRSIGIPLIEQPLC